MSTVHKKSNNDATCRKALIALACGIAQTAPDEFGTYLADYLTNVANGGGCDAETADLLSDLVLVIRPPAPTPHRKFAVIQGGAA